MTLLIGILLFAMLASPLYASFLDTTRPAGISQSNCHNFPVFDRCWSDTTQQILGCAGDKKCECSKVNTYAFSNCLIQCTPPGRAPSPMMKAASDTMLQNYQTVCGADSMAALGSILKNPTAISSIVNSWNSANPSANPINLNSLSSWLNSVASSTIDPSMSTGVLPPSAMSTAIITPAPTNPSSTSSMGSSTLGTSSSTGTSTSTSSSTVGSSTTPLPKSTHLTSVPTASPNDASRSSYVLSTVVAMSFVLALFALNL